MDITNFVMSQREKALNVGDHATYRKQLARRLLVVRKKLNYTVKGRKYNPKTPITVQDIGRNHEYVHSIPDRLLWLICQVHFTTPTHL